MPEMKIRLLNDRAELVSPTLEQEEFVRDVVAYDNREFLPYAHKYVTTRVSMVARDGSFPLGAVGPLEKLAAEENYQVIIQDLRQRPKPQVDEAIWDEAIPSDLNPFPFQREAVRRALSRGMGIIEADVGAGKSLIAGMTVLAMPVRWVVLVHRSHLVADLSKLFARLGIEHVTHTSDRRKVADVTIATYSSAKDPAVADKLMGGADGVIVDECFPAGTMVGNKAIELISAGDLVPSFCEVTGSFVERRVVRVFRSFAPRLVTVCAGGYRVACTPNHPFLTQRGWVAAEDLVPGDEVRNVQSVAVPDDVLRMLPGDDGRHEAEARPGAPLREGVLLEDVCNRGQTPAYSSTLVCEDPGGEGGVRTSQLQACPREESNHAPGGPGEDPRSKAGAAVEAPRSRGERVPSDVSGASADGSSQPDMAAPSQNRSPAWVWHPHGLQGGPGFTAGEAGYRGGWPDALREETGAGRQEDRRPGWSRVDCPPVHEQGGPDRDRQGRVGHTVYNLEVEGTHTYVANGLVVHNCHTLAADTHVAVFRAARKAYYRIGLSGTPLSRTDARNIVAVSHLGGVIYRVKPQELVAMGRTVAAEVYMSPFRHKVPKRTEYNAIYREAIVNNVDRNKLLVKMIKKARKPTMVFVTQTEQMRNLEQLLLAEDGLRDRFALAWGDLSSSERQAVQEQARTGDIDVVLTNVTFQEGVNIPNLGSVVIAGAGKAPIQIIQRLGRGVRASEGKEDFELWDVRDDEIEMFHKQALARMRIYRTRGYEPKILEDL